METIETSARTATFVIVDLEGTASMMAGYREIWIPELV